MNLSTFLFMLVFLFGSWASYAESGRHRLSDLPEPTPTPSSFIKNPFAPPPTPVIEEERVSAATIQRAADDFAKKGQDSLARGKYDEAEGYFDRALLLDPKNKDARRGIDFIMKKMEPSTTPTKPSSPSNLTKMKNQLNAAVEAGKLEHAKLLAEKILVTYPNDAATKKTLGDVNARLRKKALDQAKEHEDLGDYEGALTAIVSAERLGANVPRERVALLKAKVLEQNKTKSQALYKQALEAAQAGHNNTAIDLAQKALVYDPANIQAENMLRRLHPDLPK